jgi:dTDP-4-dehydrorhamnose reductase
MNILITGGAGLLAGYLIETAPPQAALGAIWHAKPIECDGCAREQCDITDRTALRDLVSRLRPDWVIHAAGIGNVDLCQNDPVTSRLANVGGTGNIIESCRAAGCRLLYVSTNAVYRGDAPPCAEDAPQEPVNEYGRQKKQCEELVRASGLEWTIVRPILMYGWSRDWSRRDPVVWMLETMRAGGRLNLVDDISENPLSAEECAAAIWRVIETGQAGEFNIAGGDIVSRYQLGQAVAKAFGCDPSLISAVGSGYFKSLAPRPRNTSFDTGKMEAVLGLRPLPLGEGLGRMRDTRPRDMGRLIKGRLRAP